MRITDLTALIEQGTMLTGPVRPRTTADQARIRKAVRRTGSASRARRAAEQAF